ncbi:uncharacterized protein KY384_009212 [Bacidia gigantensis]|uniref:uncharacterized protein n=1 Tax=Bacidia gigantensis TaxID=2732470 RepID=UPI001D0363B8|nr:uncharacterized protein KY384_009212 [Bacidia gigantensis]KAG8525568.1 hypothetical protein KY384_009212 [Bacidia gigantensis]
MATSKPSVLTPYEEVMPQELPKWKIDNVNKEMQRFQDKVSKASKSSADPETADILKCKMENSQAAMYFHCFVNDIVTWQGSSAQEYRDPLAWLRTEARMVVFDLKNLMSSMENEFKNDKFLRQTCFFEWRGINVLLNNPKNADGEASPNSLFNYIHALNVCFKDDKDSVWSGLYLGLCRKLMLAFQDTELGLLMLIERYDGENVSVGTHGVRETPESTRPQQSGLRRRRPNVESQPSSSDSELSTADADPKSHAEAWLRLAQASYGIISAYSWTELKEALWRDERASVAWSMILTSTSSILLGVAFSKHYRDSHPGLDSDFYILLSDTILQLFSLYILMIPFLRGYEPAIRGTWFGLSIALSVALSVACCIVHPYQWHASEVIRFAEQMLQYSELQTRSMAMMANCLRIAIFVAAILSQLLVDSTLATPILQPPASIYGRGVNFQYTIAGSIPQVQVELYYTRAYPRAVKQPYIFQPFEVIYCAQNYIEKIQLLIQQPGRDPRTALGDFDTGEREYAWGEVYIAFDHYVGQEALTLGQAEYLLQAIVSGAQDRETIGRTLTEEAAITSTWVNRRFTGPMQLLKRQPLEIDQLPS